MPTPIISNTQLADTLTNFADNILNPGAHDAEQAIRLAALRLRQTDDPLPVIPSLVAEIRQLAIATSDPETRAGLRNMIGD